MKIKGKYRKIETAIKDVEKCLVQYYRTDESSKNEWRFKNALDSAKKQLKETGECKLIGSQWGSKFGNYKRCVALNNKGTYTYAEGFDNDIKRILGTV